MIPEPIRHEIVAHALANVPYEACGLLAGRGGKVERFYAIRNAEESPVRYSLHPQDQLHAMLDLEDAGLDLLAVYHSHTRTRAYPSDTDRNLATLPGLLYVIVSLANRAEPDLRAFELVPEVVEEPIQFVS